MVVTLIEALGPLVLSSTSFSVRVVDKTIPNGPFGSSGSVRIVTDVLDVEIVKMTRNITANTQEYVDKEVDSNTESNSHS